MNRITSADNPVIKETARLAGRKGRAGSGLILLEGPHLLAEALAAGSTVVRLFYLADWAETVEGADLLAQARSAGAVPYEVTGRLMGKVATTDTPPPVTAVAAVPTSGTESLQAGLLIDGLQDPGNLGTILRTAWGAGVETILAAPGTVDFYAPKVLRAAQGAHFHLHLREEKNRGELLDRIRREGWWVTAAQAGAKTPYWEALLKKPCLICIGNEARGLAPDLLAAADETVAIPLAPGVDSLNAAISAGVLLFELQRRSRVRTG